MQKLTLTCFITLILTNSLFAQTLFTYGGHPVDKSEFLRVYKKNAINKEPDYSEGALREYLDLYSLFKMKVKEAELMKLDTVSSIQYELGNYRKQLASKYLTDEEVKRQQIVEAYERGKEVVKVAHIMKFSSPTAPSKDTVQPYKTIDSIYTAISKGKVEFASIATLSDDKSSAANGGELGYISVLKTVYDFENAAYNTPVGKISKPFKTQYGYHIIKVLDRKPNPGEVEVAQIMIAAPMSRSAEERAEAKVKAEKVLVELKKGGNFEALVEKYSEDTYSKENKGVLQKFSVGAYVPDFENAAFGLKKTGDISKVIETEYGYHILKLINKYPIQPYDSVKANLAKMIERDSRAQVAQNMFFDKIKKKNNFKEYPANIEKLKETFVSLVAPNKKGGGDFNSSDFKGPDYSIFDVKKVNYKATDVLAYIEKVTNGRIQGQSNFMFDDILENYITTIVTDIEEENLINEKPEFMHLMQEYRDGIMLFELMDRQVWGKASKDTTGLKKFYEQNKKNYMWDAGFRGKVYTFRNKVSMDKGMKLINKKGMTDELLLETMNTKETPNAVSIQKGYYEYDKHKDISKDVIESGESLVGEQQEDGSYTVTIPDNVYSNGANKNLDEARGYVIAEYQDHLEKSWNEQLRNKYPVKVNEEVFKSMVK